MIGPRAACPFYFRSTSTGAMAGSCPVGARSSCGNLTVSVFQPRWTSTYAPSKRVPQKCLQLRYPDFVAVRLTRASRTLRQRDSHRHRLDCSAFLQRPIGGLECSARKRGKKRRGRGCQEKAGAHRRRAHDHQRQLMCSCYPCGAGKRVDCHYVPLSWRRSVVPCCRVGSRSRSAGLSRTKDQ